MQNAAAAPLHLIFGGDGFGVETHPITKELAVMEAVQASLNQLKLFHIENPLTVRLGADFFRLLPSVPGVYFFHGKDGELLYIGQSLDLKARIGSYRHVTPEKIPKRTLKLVHRMEGMCHASRCNQNWASCARTLQAIAFQMTFSPDLTHQIHGSPKLNIKTRKDK